MTFYPITIEMIHGGKCAVGHFSLAREFSSEHEACHAFREMPNFSRAMPVEPLKLENKIEKKRKK